MVHDAAKGMLYLHTRLPPIAHRDFKSANLLVGP
jgi:serine/threonine protein kinase